MITDKLAKKLVSGITLGMLVMQCFPVTVFGATNDPWAGLKTRFESIYSKAVYTINNPGTVARQTGSKISKYADLKTKSLLTKLNNEKEGILTNYQSLKNKLGSLQLTNTLRAPLNNYLAVKRSLYTGNKSQSGINQSQLALLRNDSSLQAINLTDEEWLRFATLAYANFARNETEFDTIYRNMTIAQLDQYLDNNSQQNIGFGSIPDEYHRANLDAMANNTKLANFTLAAYKDNNGDDGFVGLAFRVPYLNNSTFFAFRGSEGSRASEGKEKSDSAGTSAASQQSKDIFNGISQWIKGKLQLVDELTTPDWIDSYQTGFRSKSKQFDSVREFVEKNRDSGQIYVTGHSKGATNAAYACAAFGNCSGVAFDGIGIGHTLTDDQRMNLTTAPFLNWASYQDPLSAFLFHNENRALYKNKKELNVTVVKNGKLANETVTGPIAGHYVQAKYDLFDQNGYLNVTNEWGSNSLLTENISQLLYFGNKATGEPLGIAVDWLDKIKNKK